MNFEERMASDVSAGHSVAVADLIFLHGGHEMTPRFLDTSGSYFGLL